MGIVLDIDAVNIRGGGGLTHLSQLLYACNIEESPVDRVRVWASKTTNDQLPDLPWIEKKTLPWMEAGLISRTLGQHFKLPLLIKSYGSNALFSPGGTLPFISCVPMVTMSQNMLPFEPKEALRFGYFDLMRSKLLLLRYLQGSSFKRASGVIFLTRYAKNEVSRLLGGLGGGLAEVPHGIESRFLRPPLKQRMLSAYNEDSPFSILYVSILMPYKHQVEIAHAVAKLRQKGLPIEIKFIGSSWGRYGRLFIRLIQKLDPKAQFIKWYGNESFEGIHEHYHHADMFVFGSSCENLPNILIEAMAAGLPIACSNRGPMPEILKDAGIYFDPDNVDSIANCIERLAEDVELREKLAVKAFNLGGQYSWRRCANDTFNFIARIALENKANK